MNSSRASAMSCWRRAGLRIASSEAWVAAIDAGTNDLEPPALKVEPVIGDVLSALRETDGVRLARMSGSGATCFAIFGSGAEAARRGESDRRGVSRLVGARRRIELNQLRS